MNINQQAPTRRLISDGRRLLVHSIFATIQGEGPFAGTPATFIRLAGCNLLCPLCDTEYTDGAETLDLDTILARLDPHLKLVVITGGEPFRQNIAPLCERLHRGPGGHTVQIETNGKLPAQSFDVYEFATIVVSPKTEHISAEVAAQAACYKYVVQHGDVAPDGLPIHALGHPVRVGQTIARPPDHHKVPIFIQPADEKDADRNRANMEAAVAAVMMDPNQRRLCLQMHKYAGLE